MSTNILVVEDSSAMRALIVGVVEQIGAQAYPVGTGEEAVEVFQEQPIDLVVMDVEMPGINGFETCRQLRAIRSEWFPVIYLSASSSDEHIVEGLDAGGDAYVTKPVNPRVLEAILNAMGRIAEMKAELREANRKLQNLAHHDGLTHVFNRRGFDENLSSNWRKVQRDDTNLAMLLIDVDHFKLFNDQYGHLDGDACLQRIANQLKDDIKRPTDIVARYGGEEFAILLPEINLNGARIVGERIIQGIRQLNIAHEPSPTADYVTVSMGLAMASECDSPEALIAMADAMLYEAKETGRNRLVY